MRVLKTRNGIASANTTNFPTKVEKYEYTKGVYMEKIPKTAVPEDGQAFTIGKCVKTK